MHYYSDKECGISVRWIPIFSSVINAVVIAGGGEKKGKSTKSVIDHIHLKQFASYSKAQILKWQC